MLYILYVKFANSFDSDEMLSNAHMCVSICPLYMHAQNNCYMYTKKEKKGVQGD